MAYILIISSDPLFRAYVGAELIEVGHRADGLETIEEAAASLSSMARIPKLVLIEAKEQNFEETAVKKLARASTLVVCAGNYDMARIDFIHLGINHIIKKPISIGELIKQVIDILKKSMH